MYVNMLRGASDEVKLEVATILLASVTYKDEVAETPPPPPLSEEERKAGLMKLAGSWAERDNEMLDAALAGFSGDFGGSADARNIARELRQGAEMVRDVKTW